MPRQQVCFELYRQDGKVCRASDDAEFRVPDALLPDRTWDCFVLELDVAIVRPNYLDPVGDCDISVHRAWHELIDRDEDKQLAGLPWLTITKRPAEQSVIDAVWREYEDEIMEMATDLG